MNLKPLLLASLITPATAMANFSNTSYSFFGTGAEIVNYKEKVKNFGGFEIESDYSAVNINQRSGGYTAVDDRFGFFIRTASTLIATEENEEWSAKGLPGNVQEDTAAMNFQMLDISGAYHFGNGAYALAGIHYQKISFSRFGWKKSTSTDAFSQQIENGIRNDPKQLDYITRLVNGQVKNSSGQTVVPKDKADKVITTVEEYFKATRFDPEKTLPVVFEDASSFSLTGGVEYDSYFVDQSLGMRYLLGSHVGLNIYENVLNSGENRALTRSFGGGVDLRLTAGIGYQFRPEVGALLFFETNASWTKGIKEKLNDAQTVQLPDNTFVAHAINGTIYWNF